MKKNYDLSQFPFFSGISRDRLAELETLSIVQTFSRGDTIAGPARSPASIHASDFLFERR